MYIFLKKFIIPDSLEDEKRYPNTSTEQKNNHIAELADYAKELSNNLTGTEQLTEKLEKQEYLRKREEEKKALQFVYSDCFVEVEKDKIWNIKLFLEFLSAINEEENKESNECKIFDKKICREFLQGNCKLGNCSFVHEKPEIPSKTCSKTVPFIILEIRFREGT